MNVRTTIGVVIFLLSAAYGLGRGPAGDARAQDHRGPKYREDAMQATKPSDNEIVLTRTFASPRDAAFAALTQAEHIRKWMKPSDFTLVTCEVDLKAGGSFRYVFERKSSKKIEVRGKYESVDPPRQFVYMETYDFSPLKVHVTTALEEADKKTVFKQTLRYASKKERDADFEGVATSAREVYGKLEEYLGQLKK